MVFSRLQPRGQMIAVFAICFVLRLTIAVAITSIV